MATIRWYIQQVLIAFDQMLNALAGGWADETFSARCHRRRGDWLWNFYRKIVNGIFFWQDDHCKQAYINEIKGTQNSLEYEEMRKKI